MKPPSELTDAELDEAVARECLVEPMWDGCHKFEPTTDARDAERVWEWLTAKGYEVWVSSRPGGKFEVELNDPEYEAPKLQAHVEYDDEGWKRAICLAALAVARRKETR